VNDACSWQHIGGSLMFDVCSEGAAAAAAAVIDMGTKAACSQNSKLWEQQPCSHRCHVVPVGSKVLRQFITALGTVQSCRKKKITFCFLL